MVTKINKLLYQFDNISVDGTFVDINLADLEMSEGGAFDDNKGAYLIDTTVISRHASLNGTDRRACGIGIGASTSSGVFQGGFYESGSGNILLDYSAPSKGTVRVTLNLKINTATDMKVFIEISGYSQD